MSQIAPSTSESKVNNAIWVPKHPSHCFWKQHGHVLCLYCRYNGNWTTLGLSKELSMSVSTCTAQSGSMQKTTCSLSLAKRWRGSSGNKWKKTKGEGWGEQDEGRGIRRSQSWKQMWFQLPLKRSNVFCLVKLVWQPVPNSEWSPAEWPCFWMFFYIFVLAKSWDAQSMKERVAERMGWIVLGN